MVLEFRGGALSFWWPKFAYDGELDGNEANQFVDGLLESPAATEDLVSAKRVFRDIYLNPQARAVLQRRMGEEAAGLISASLPHPMGEALVQRLKSAPTWDVAARVAADGMFMSDQYGCHVRAFLWSSILTAWADSRGDKSFYPRLIGTGPCEVELIHPITGLPRQAKFCDHHFSMLGPDDQIVDPALEPGLDLPPKPMDLATWVTAVHGPEELKRDPITCPRWVSVGPGTAEFPAAKALGTFEFKNAEDVRKGYYPPDLRNRITPFDAAILVDNFKGLEGFSNIKGWGPPQKAAFRAVRDWSLQELHKHGRLHTGGLAARHPDVAQLLGLA